MPVKINGATSGSVTLAAPATGSDVTLTLPGSVGTSGQLLSTNGAGVLSFVNGAKILQVVRATDTTNRSTTSTSLTDVTGMSVSITPQQASSSILIICSFHHFQDSGAADCRGVFAITNSGNTAISGGQEATSGLISNTATNRYMTVIAYDSPNTTSATTYKLRFRTVNASSSTQVLNSNNTGQIFAIEVAA